MMHYSSVYLTLSNLSKFFFLSKYRLRVLIYTLQMHDVRLVGLFFYDDRCIKIQKLGEL